MHRKFQINTVNRDFARTLISQRETTPTFIVGEIRRGGKWDVRNNMKEGRRAQKTESERRTFKKKSSLTIFGRCARYVHWLRIALFRLCKRVRVRVNLKLCHCFESMRMYDVRVFSVYSCHIDCLQPSRRPII